MMGKIQIKRVRRSFFKSEIVVVSNLEDLSGYVFSYDRLKKVNVCFGRELVLETDGGGYINFASLGKTFAVQDYDLFGMRTILAFSAEKIVFDWKSRSSSLVSKDCSVRVDVCGIPCELRENGWRDGGGVVIEFDNCDTLLCVGVAAYFWVRTEISGDITA